MIGSPDEAGRDAAWVHFDHSHVEVVIELGDSCYQVVIRIYITSHQLLNINPIHIGQISQSDHVHIQDLVLVEEGCHVTWDSR